METQMMCFGVVVVTFTMVALQIMKALWLGPKKVEKCLRNQGFKGNSYNSIHGDLPEITRLTKSSLSKPFSSFSHDIIPRIMPIVHQTILKFGMKSFIWYGRRPRVNITNPEEIKEIFNRYEIFQKECPGGIKATFGLVMREGENWAKVRKILNPAFHLDNLKRMLPIMRESCETMIKTWEEEVTKEGSSSGEVDVWASFSSMSADVIARTAFGSCYEDGKRLIKLQDEHISITFGMLRSITNYIPGWNWVIPSKLNRRKKEVDKELQEIVKGLINQRKESMKSGKMKQKNDLLGIMLDSNEKEMEESEGSGMTMEDVIEECKLFHLAAGDTTAALLTWSMLLLSQHQDWQTKARDEVFNHFGKDYSTTTTTLDYEHINHLKIVTMIINETLRFYPPVTSLSRMIHKKSNLKKMQLLDGTEFNLATIIVHRDPEIWGDDANEFNPGRFSEGVSKAAKVPGAFFPFGGGPRVCIGQNFALIEAKQALVMILQRFSFELSPSYVHAPRCLVSLQPQFGAPLILKTI